MEFTKRELRLLKKRMSFFRKKGYKFSFELEDIFDYSNGGIIISVFNGRLYDPKDVGVKFLRENHFFTSRKSSLLQSGEKNGAKMFPMI